jgi:hypothetical protein
MWCELIVNFKVAFWPRIIDTDIEEKSNNLNNRESPNKTSAVQRQFKQVKLVT